MTDEPWSGDAVSLVDAFRAGERSPVEELDATLAAVAASQLNAMSHLDPEAALAVAKDADVQLPFGGVPMAVKLGSGVAGWPASEASIPLRDLEHGHDSTMVSRLRTGGSVLFGQSTMSEFAGLNQTRTKLHGATRNPWNTERTPGGSSGGASALVAGGAVHDRNWRRRRWFDPDPCGLLWVARIEGHLRPHPEGARGPSRQHDFGSRLSVALSS